MNARDTPYIKVGAVPGEDWFTRGSIDFSKIVYEGANVNFEPDHGSILESRIQQAKAREDRGRDDRGLDRE